MICNKLLTRVLELTFDISDIWLHSSSTIGYGTISSEYYINIYELMYKCKEWVAKNSTFTLQSYCNEKLTGVCRVKVGDGQEIYKTIANNEPEAIFKATKWILDNKDK